MIAAIRGTPAAAYEIYQWVDEDGITHYSQWEPSDATAKTNRPELTTGNYLQQQACFDDLIDYYKYVPYCPTSLCG